MGKCFHVQTLHVHNLNSLRTFSGSCWGEKKGGDFTTYVGEDFFNFLVLFRGGWPYEHNVKSTKSTY